MCEPERELMSLYGAELADRLSAHHNAVSSDVRYDRIPFVPGDCVCISKLPRNAKRESGS